MWVNRFPKNVVASSSPRDIQKLSGHRPELHTLGDPAWAGRLGLITSSGPFQTYPFCDSVMVLSTGCREIPAPPWCWSLSSISFCELNVCRAVYDTFSPSALIVLPFLTYIFLEAPPSWLRVPALPCGGSLGACWGQGRFCLFHRCHPCSPPAPTSGYLYPVHSALKDVSSWKKTPFIAYAMGL